MRIWITCILGVLILGKAVLLRNEQLIAERRVYGPRMLKFYVEPKSDGMLDVRAIDHATGESSVARVRAIEETVTLNR